jgi:hypothetical protein
MGFFPMKDSRSCGLSVGLLCFGNKLLLEAYDGFKTDGFFSWIKFCDDDARLEDDL